MYHLLAAYLPRDRCHALGQNQSLPDRTQGTALFADLSGFTPLTEALVRSLGPRCGAEEMAQQINQVYDALITHVHAYGGSVIGFAGDAMTCYFDGDDGLRAVACGLAMQTAMQAFGALSSPTGEPLSLGLKVGIASGPVRRLLVGNPEIQLLEVLAGETLLRMAEAEHQAERGDIVLDETTAQTLKELLRLAPKRSNQTQQQQVIVTGLTREIPPTPWPELPHEAEQEQALRCFPQ